MAETTPKETLHDERNLAALLSSPVKPGLGTAAWVLAEAAFARLRGRRAVPKHVRYVLSTMENHGFEAFAVGGAVRDLLLGRPPGDWDVATSAEPRYVASIFPRAVPTGVRHGTLTVLCPGDKEVDVTTYRAEGPYSDRRRPDHVTFIGSLEEDLARRDFTINAIALSLAGRIRDPHGGVRDLGRRVIRCVGDPDERFSEDALRMMRAVRFATDLEFGLDPGVAAAIRRHADLMPRLAVERIRDEFDRCLVSAAPARALELLRILGLLRFIVPELLEGVGFEQNEYHAYSVWEHTLLAVAGTPPSRPVRLAALFHDIAKPRTLSIEDGRRHFFSHEKVGAEMASTILTRLRYDRAVVNHVTHLVKHHMALHWQPEMKDAAVRRLINRVGPENIPDLILLRRADRRATGTKEGPIGLGTVALLVRIERLLRKEKAFTVADLAVDGEDVMRVAKIGPGPQVGLILKRLLEEVLEDPAVNEKSRLEERIRDMVHSTSRR